MGCSCKQTAQISPVCRCVRALRPIFLTLSLNSRGPRDELLNYSRIGPERGERIACSSPRVPTSAIHCECRGSLSSPGLYWQDYEQRREVDPKIMGMPSLSMEEEEGADIPARTALDQVDVRKRKCTVFLKPTVIMQRTVQYMHACVQNNIT